MSDFDNFSGHRARKRFGQNFLHDDSVIDRIVLAIAPRPGEHLLEIGPGQAALTSVISAQLNDNNLLTLLELDRDLAAGLEAKLADNHNIELIQTDALDYDFSGHVKKTAQPLRVFGNLPYNISTPLIFHLLQQNHDDIFTDMHFMLQKEVVDRMCAVPGSKTYGRLSVMVQYYCHTQPLFEVPPSAFKPQPKVTSAVVRLCPYGDKPVSARDDELFGRVVSAAFSQRRKTIRNTLSTLISADSLTRLGIDPNSRAETLSVEDFVGIANAID